ncbi:hypothetical protein EV424DRAFT_1410963 [Suillus variegatus]|nr:hypothetical protein EV424DRAFT_1410963 [Suillus variegatus]
MGFGSLTWSRMLVLSSTLNAGIPCTFTLLGSRSAQLAALTKEAYVNVSPSISQLDDSVSLLWHCSKYLQITSQVSLYLVLQPPHCR